MDNPKERFFSMTDNLFTFTNFACDCVTDIENIKPGEVKETVKMQCLPDKPIRFAFTTNRGMVRLAKTGAINSDHILTELIAIRDGNKESLFSFFSEYGFFFPIDTDDYEAVDMDSLFGMVNRIKSVVDLMSSISETRKDYKKILGLTLYLLFTHPIELSFSCFGKQPFKTCEHPLYTELESVRALFRHSVHEPELIDANDGAVYTITDSIFSPTYQVKYEDFSNIVGGYDETCVGSKNSVLFKEITRLYCNSTDLSAEMRRTIEFIFHFQHSIAVIKKYVSDGSLEFYDTDENVKRRYLENFNDNMKQALIDVAKTVIRDEVGYNIGGMRPHYDISTMSPAWEIQDLLTGIYVSIFFMRPGMELYRKCNNPSCDRLFLVNTTSAKRKYCSSSCRNANAQRAHRFRKLSSVQT